MNERVREDDCKELPGGPIVRGAWAHKKMQAVLREFGKSAFGRASVCMEFYSFLSGVLRAEFKYPVEKLPVALEIGTFNGISAMLLSELFGHVECVTIEAQKPSIKRQEIFDFLGITNVTVHEVKTNEEKAEVIKALDFDFCYQDGDHTNDTYTDFDLVKRCGRVLFHEYWPLQAPVWNLVNSLPLEEMRFAQWDCLAMWIKK